HAIPRVQTHSKIASLQKKLSVTTVYVTHEQTEAMTLGDRVVVMRKGVIQQVGSPDELYASPTNLFVASFIGSPSMNFMPGRLRGDVVSTGFGDIHLPECLVDAASRATSESVILGLRPEAFEDAYLVAPEKRDQGMTISANLSLVETTGADRFVYFSPPVVEKPTDAAREAGIDELGGELIARLTNATLVASGDTMDLWFTPESLYLFDGETGESLRTDEVRAQ